MGKTKPLANVYNSWQAIDLLALLSVQKVLRQVSPVKSGSLDTGAWYLLVPQLKRGHTLYIMATLWSDISQEDGFDRDLT